MTRLYEAEIPEYPVAGEPAGERREGAARYVATVFELLARREGYHIEVGHYQHAAYDAHPAYPDIGRGYWQFY